MVNNYCTILNIYSVDTGLFWKLMYMKAFFFPPNFFLAGSVSQSTSLQRCTRCTIWKGMDQSSERGAVMNPQAGCISNNIPCGEFSCQLGILAIGAIFDVCLLVKARLDSMHLLCLTGCMLPVARQ